MLTRAGCQTRQERFRALLADQQIDAAVITDPPEIYYLTGQLFRSLPAFLYIEREGASWLAASTEDGDALIDDRVTYEPHTLFTLNPDLMRRLARVVSARLAGTRQARRIGWQAESLPRLLGDVVAEAIHPDEWVPIDDDIAALEKRKDPDEVELLRKAIGCSLAAYDADRAAIAPGVNELVVLEAGHTAATLYAGETVHHGGDYRCGEFGGPARDREIQAGELYIIDAQSTYRGYAADLCRAFAVSEPTPLQQEVFDLLAAILAELPHRVRPGGHGAELWQWIDRRIREHPHLRETGLIHHGGHGVGLRPHEAPDINRDRDGIFEVGDVVSCEPGAYSPALNAGIRLENTFLVTESGCALLSDYPVALT
ncbi:MAG: M24 family metallopeptidase [Thermomicrobiales bacterium]